MDNQSIEHLQLSKNANLENHPLIAEAVGLLNEADLSIKKLANIGIVVNYTVNEDLFWDKINPSSSEYIQPEKVLLPLA